MEGQLPIAEHGKDKLTIEQRRPIVVMRVVAVGKCLVRVLIHAGVVEAVGVRDISVERKALVSADAVRSERRVVIGAGQTRPKQKRTADLGSGRGGRAKLELRLDSLED